MWPDWHGKTAVIVATGPSVIDCPLELARGRASVIAIKSTYRICPWADILYGTDKGWWIANRGAKDFEGLRVTASPTVVKLFRGVELVKLSPGLFSLDGKLRGSHSGLVAINLAINLGARRIVLAGFDMTLKFGKRYMNGEEGVAPVNPQRVKQWCSELDGLYYTFMQAGVELINCSLVSALRAYKVRSFADVFDGDQSNHRSDQPGHQAIS